MTHSTPRRFAGRFLFIAVTLAFLVGSAAFPASAQVAITQPESYEAVDLNGVNVASGSVIGQPHSLSIGPSDQGGLSMSFTMDTANGSFFRSSLEGIISKFPLFGEGSHRPWFSLTIMGQTSIWIEAVEGFFPVDAEGTLAFDGRYYTHTAIDGTVTTLDQQLRTSAFILGRVTTIVRPSGEILTFHWKSVATGGTPMYERRLQSVTNNLGYQLHFQYAADVWGTGWSSLIKATALNNAVDACAPLSNTCTFSRTWPSLALTSTATLRTITDATGNVTRYNINGARLVSIQRPAASTPNLTFTWNSLTPTKVATVTDGVGTWQYAFSPTPETPEELEFYYIDTTITDPHSHQTSVTSGSWHEDPLPGRRVNRVLWVTNALNQTTAYAYGDVYRLEQVMQPEGDRMLFSYNDVGALTSATRIAKPPTSGLPASTTVTAQMACLSPITCNLPTKITDARGAETDYAYDLATGVLLTETGPAPTLGATRPQVRHSYQAFNAWYRTAPGSGLVQNPQPVWRRVSTSACAVGASCAGTAQEVKTTVAYQAGGASTASNILPLSVSTGAGDGSLMATTTTAWDENGDPKTIDGPLAGSADTTWYAYDLMRRMRGQIGPDPDGPGGRLFPAVRTTYDGDARPTLVERGTTTAQSSTAWAAFDSLQSSATQYDSRGRKVRETAFAGSTNPSITQYAYDNEGRLLCTAQRMNPATFPNLPTSACVAASVGAFGPDRIAMNGYDDADRLTSVVEGIGATTQRTVLAQAWTANGKIDWIEDANGNRSDYVYDEFDRLTRLYFPSPTTGAHAANLADYEQYGFDANDNPITKRVRSGQSFTTTFDALNRITVIDAPAGTNDVAFTYDLLGRRLTAAHPGGQTIASTWDALGRETSQTSPLGSMAYQYDLAGRRIRMTWPGGGYANYGWDLDNAMRSITWGPAATPITTYAYDNLGRRAGITRGNGVITSYGYNTASQLTALTHDLAGTANDVSYTFTHSPAAQVTARTVSNSAYAYTPTIGTAAYVNNGLNQTISAGGVAVGWTDNRGNMTSDGVRTFTYDAANRLLSGGGSNLTYDPLDRLHQMTGTGAGRFQYDGSQLAAVYDASGTLLGRYVGGQTPDEWAMMEDGGVTLWPLQDAQGSVIALTNTAGNATAILAYDEYGRPRSGNTGRMQYTGQFVLPNLGLYHYKARGYHAGLGRFVQTDPVGYQQGLNLYAYVANDPVNRTDPTGECERRTNPDGSTYEVGICGTSRDAARFIAGRIADPDSAIGEAEAAAVSAGVVVEFEFGTTGIDGAQVEGGRTETAVLPDGTTVTAVTIDRTDIAGAFGVNTDTGQRATRELTPEEIAEHEIAGHVYDRLTGRPPNNERRAIDRENAYRRRAGIPFRRIGHSGYTR